MQTGDIVPVICSVGKRYMMTAYQNRALLILNLSYF